MTFMNHIESKARTTKVPYLSLVPPIDTSDANEQSLLEAIKTKPRSDIMAVKQRVRYSRFIENRRPTITMATRRYPHNGPVKELVRGVLTAIDATMPGERKPTIDRSAFIANTIKTAVAAGLFAEGVIAAKELIGDRK
jgi:hypothetical protein